MEYRFNRSQACRLSSHGVNVSETERAVSLVVGGALAVRAIQRMDIVSLALAAHRRRADLPRSDRPLRPLPTDGRTQRRSTSSRASGTPRSEATTGQCGSKPRARPVRIWWARHRSNRFQRVIRPLGRRPAPCPCRPERRMCRRDITSGFKTRGDCLPLPAVLKLARSMPRQRRCLGDRLRRLRAVAQIVVGFGDVGP